MTMIAQLVFQNGRTWVNRLKYALRVVTVLSLVMTALGPNMALAEALTSLSIVLGNSKDATVTNLRVSFTTVTAIAGDTTSSDDDGKLIIRFPLNAGGDPFGVSGALVAGNISLVSGFPSEVTVQSVTLSSSGGSVANDTITIGLNQTSGASAAININGGTALIFDILTNKITTPTKIATAGTADIWQLSVATRANGASVDLDTGSSHVATNDATVGSATFRSTIAFTLSAIASGTSVLGVTTDTASTATTVPFGTLAPNAEYEVAQRLTIISNAPNGYNVYVLQNGNLTSGQNDIDSFKDGTRIDDSVAVAWTSPAVVTGSEETYGHMGYSSTDSQVFGTINRWAGVPTIGGTGVSPSTLGLVCDGTAPTTSAICDVVYKAETSSQQEAGTYANELYYVIVPIY